MKINTKELKNIKISIVCPVFLRGDAVGHSAHDYFRACQELGFLNIRALGARNDYPDLEFELCEDAISLKNNNWFKQSDLVIYHYAIFHDLFEVLKEHSKYGRHVVCFHNVTPKNLMPKFTWEIIDKSFKQIQLFKYANAIWVDSRENLEELNRQGIKNLPFVEIPIAVDRPAITSLLRKPRKQIDVVCVGRFFSSKGILDIIEAIDLMVKLKAKRFILRLVGNTDFSDPAYIKEVKAKIHLLGLGEYIDFIGKVDELTLARIYRQSHILVSASYHEGFCVPVIEALRAGMIPVTYDAGNLKWIASGNGRVVPTGDIDALALALTEVVDGINKSFDDPDKLLLPLDSGAKSPRQFSEEAREYSCGFSFNHFTVKLNKAITDVFSNER